MDEKLGGYFPVQEEMPEEFIEAVRECFRKLDRVWATAKLIGDKLGAFDIEHHWQEITRNTCVNLRAVFHSYFHLLFLTYHA